VEIVGKSRKTVTRTGIGDAMQFNVSEMGKLQRILGEADAVNILKTLPGLGTVGDYGSGLSIQGNDFSGTTYQLEGATVFFPFHFGGIFSTFNAEHFPIVKLEKSIHDASMGDCIGGKVELRTYRQITERLSGAVNVGMTASSLTLKIPLSEHTDIIASGRVSYINQLYRWMLHTKSIQIDYDFSDFNVTLRTKASPHNLFTTNLFFNNDCLSYNDKNYVMTTGLKWSNATASCSWEHQGENITHTHIIAYSRYENRIENQMPSFSIKVPTDINQLSIKGDWTAHSDVWDNNNLAGGYEYKYINALPQWAEIQGYGSINPSKPNRMTGHLARVYMQYTHTLGRHLTALAGCKGIAYWSTDYHQFKCDPVVSLRYTNNNFAATAQWSGYSQSLHLVGFSEIGLSSNFWVPSCSQLPLMHSYNTALSLAYDFQWGELSTDLYYRTLQNSAEYTGNILGLLDDHYSALNNITYGRGYNYGVDVMLSKNRGPLNITLNYSYGIARRRYSDYMDGAYVTAATQAGHRAHISCSYDVADKWIFSASFTYAQGRPYTPVNSIYMVAENLLMEYGKRNSANIPNYHRLDLGITYHISSDKKHHLNHYINLSMINVYARNNVEMIAYNIQLPDGKAHCRKIHTLYKSMPSLSYTLKF
jgi:hypothetical protein